MNKIPKDEQIVMDALVEAVNSFKKLDETHPSHHSEFMEGIHKCQNVLIHKIVQRDHPEQFPTYLKKG